MQTTCRLDLERMREEDEGGEKEWVLKGCVRIGFQEFIQRYLQYLGGVGAVESLLCIYFSR